MANLRSLLIINKRFYMLILLLFIFFLLLLIYAVYMHFLPGQSFKDPGDSKDLYSSSRNTTKGTSVYKSTRSNYENWVTKDYYGMHGEFDINDEARKVSEDIQGFHSNHQGADLSDHYYWDDVLDAETDGYLDD